MTQEAIQNPGRDFDAEMHARIDAAIDLLVDGLDYGKFPPSKKKTLLQPGAKKILDAAHVTIHFTEVGRTLTTDLVVFGYSGRAVRRDDGAVLVEGKVGWSSSAEKVYNTQPPLACVGKISQMAQKCCEVSCARTISPKVTTLFTQDLEQQQYPETPQRPSSTSPERTVDTDSAQPAPPEFFDPDTKGAGVYFASFLDAFEAICKRRGLEAEWPLIYLGCESEVAKVSGGKVSRLENCSPKFQQLVLDRLSKNINPLALKTEGERVNAAAKAAAESRK